MKKPSAAERRTAERIAANLQFINERSDAELDTIEQDHLLDEDTLGAVNAERNRRRT